MKPAILVLAAVALAAPAALAQPAPDAGLPRGACIRPGEIVNHTLGADGRTMYLLVNGRGTYRLTMRGACLQGATRSDAVQFGFASAISKACTPSDLRVTIHKSGPRPCFVDSISQLSRAEARALPKDERP